MSLRERFPQYFTSYSPDPELYEVDDEPASSFLRKAMFDSLRKFEPDSSLEGFASIRLFGDRYEGGVFDDRAADVFHKLQQEVEAAAPDAAAEDVRMAIASIGEGSLVLNLKPFHADVPPDHQIPASGPSMLENALLRVLDLHAAVESGLDSETLTQVGVDWANRLRQLVESLDNADAGLEIDLSRWNGDRRRSTLSNAGRINAHRMFERVPHVSTEILSGVLAGISIDGEFAKVQLQSGKRKLDIYETPSHEAKRIPWDQQLRIEVRTVAQADKFGAQSKSRSEFIRILGHDEPMPAT